MSRRVIKLFCLLTLVFLGAATSQAAENQGLRNEANFFSIEPITFYFHYGDYFSRLVLKSSEARIWYSFQAADFDSLEKPLLVFFNGGPGSATSSGLMSMGTGKYILDNRVESGGGDFFIPNTVPWTRLGNLLYIDARQAGFSYCLMDSVQDSLARIREFNSQNFNPFFDAADFIRVLLRFLAQHPDLQDNPVVIVGESYGGMRAICMLHILLNYADYGNGFEMYQDQALAEEIQAHFDIVFPQHRNTVVPPEIITRQFGHQILIQPALAWQYQTQMATDLLNQPGSLLYKIGEEVGIPYDPAVYDDIHYYVRDVAGRDVYMYTKPRDWLTGFFQNASRLLRYVQNLELVTGFNVTGIPELYASARTRAYRVYDPDYPTTVETQDIPYLVKLHFLEPARLEASAFSQEPGDLEAVFGTLQPWDRYFISTNYYANWAYHIFNVAKIRGYEASLEGKCFGRMFLKNVVHVETFITKAPLDLVVYSEAIVPSLALYSDILESIEYVEQPLAGEARPGMIVLKYLPGAFPDIQGIGTRTIRFPLYASSCHAVSLTEPLELFADVSLWLEERGLGTMGKEEYPYEKDQKFKFARSCSR